MDAAVFWHTIQASCTNGQPHFIAARELERIFGAICIKSDRTSTYYSGCNGECARMRQIFRGAPTWVDKSFCKLMPLSSSTRKVHVDITSTLISTPCQAKQGRRRIWRPSNCSAFDYIFYQNLSCSYVTFLMSHNTVVLHYM